MSTINMRQYNSECCEFDNSGDVILNFRNLHFSFVAPSGGQSSAKNKDLTTYDRPRTTMASRVCRLHLFVRFLLLCREMKLLFIK